MEETPAVLIDSPKTILVVDDNPEILAFVADILSRSSYRILTAGSGLEALLRSQHFAEDIQLLLTDFQMPGMSGIALATKISEERPRIKVLMMSGFAGGMLVLNEGWHFLAKPFIPSQLTALVRGLFSPDMDSKLLLPI